SNRAWSVSYMRSRYRPPLCVARSRLTLAVKIPPMCSHLVGDGANLVTSAPAGSARSGYRCAQCTGDGRSTGNSESIRSALSMQTAYLYLRAVLGEPGGDRSGQPQLRPI